MMISAREQKILALLGSRDSAQSSAIRDALVARGDDASLVTVKRALSAMVARGLLVATGSGRSSAYQIASVGRIFASIDARAYCAIDPDRRAGLQGYNRALFALMPEDLFSDKEQASFALATTEYARRSLNVPRAIAKKELERLVVELSWKSSKIEGNTYTLLDTERLILENKEAVGHSRSEAQMILNHKDAFAFVRENAPSFLSVSRARIEDLHAILIRDLGVGTGLRTRAVGITGSVYQPLDNQHQIREGFDALIAAIGRAHTPYDKALLAILGISYLQPFEDGNKRTARLLADALLLAHGCAPLSYRSVEEEEYREALLVFYEMNSIAPFKKIFIEQYDFAARNYTVA